MIKRIWIKKALFYLLIDNENKIIPFYSTQFIPGDIIYIPDKTLYSRIEQPAVAIVVNIEIDCELIN